MKMYSHYSNGDFNEKHEDRQDLFGKIDFEFGVGQEWILITKNKLSNKQFSDLMENLKISHARSDKALRHPLQDNSPHL